MDNLKQNSTDEFKFNQELTAQVLPASPEAGLPKKGLEYVKTTYVLIFVVLAQIVAVFLAGGSDFWLVILVGLLNWLGILFLLYRFGFKNIFGQFDWKATSLTEIFWLFAGVWLFTVFLRVTIFALSSFVSLDFLNFISDSPTQNLLSSGVAREVVIQLCIVLALPLAEEVIYRGLILKRQVFKHSILKGAILSSVIFSLLHFPDVLAIFAVAFVLSYFYLKYKNLYVPFIFHALYNGVGSLLGLLVKPESGNAGFTAEDITELKGTLKVSLTITLILGFFIVRHLRKNWASLRS